MSYMDKELLKFKYDHYNRKFNTSLNHLPFTMTSAEGLWLTYSIIESTNLGLSLFPTTAFIYGGYLVSGALMLTPAIMKYINLKRIKNEIVKYCEVTDSYQSDNDLNNLYSKIKETRNIKILKFK